MNRSSAVSKKFERMDSPDRTLAGCKNFRIGLCAAKCKSEMSAKCRESCHN